MSAELVLETRAGEPIPSDLFPPLLLGAPDEIVRTVYVRNAGDRRALHVVFEIEGPGHLAGDPGRREIRFPELKPGARVAVDVVRPPSSRETIGQVFKFCVRGIEVI